MKRYSSEAGGAIIYIFLAVGLFAALSASVAAMLRGAEGGGGINKELRMAQASEIIQYASGLRSAVQTMKIGGLADTAISFENNIVAGYNLACTDGTNACRLFYPDGGSSVYSQPDARWLDLEWNGEAAYGTWLFSGDNAVVDVGTTDADLLAILPFIHPELCLKLNEMLGVPNPGGVPPADAGVIELTAKFTGSYAESEEIGNGDTEIHGKRNGCVQMGVTPADSYHFFQVLLAR